MYNKISEVQMFFDNLPNEILINIIINLDSHSLLRFSISSKEKLALTSDPFIWKQKIIQEFPNFEIIDENYYTTYRLLYQRKLIIFYTSWCPHSQKLLSSGVLDIIDEKYRCVVKKNCGDSLYESVQIFDKYQIEGVPTILLEYGNQIYEYTGDRTIKSIEKFIEFPFKVGHIYQLIDKFIPIH